jgi:hypothetical protein
MSCRSLGFYALAAGKALPIRLDRLRSVAPAARATSAAPQEGVFSASTATSS